MIPKSDWRIIAALAAHPDADAVLRAYVYGRLYGRNEALMAGIQAVRDLPSVFGVSDDAPIISYPPKLRLVDDPVLMAVAELQRGDVE